MRICGGQTCKWRLMKGMARMAAADGRVAGSVCSSEPTRACTSGEYISGSGANLPLPFEHAAGSTRLNRNAEHVMVGVL